MLSQVFPVLTLLAYLVSDNSCIIHKSALFFYVVKETQCSHMKQVCVSVLILLALLPRTAAQFTKAPLLFSFFLFSSFFFYVVGKPVFTRETSTYFSLDSVGIPYFRQQLHNAQKCPFLFFFLCRQRNPVFTHKTSICFSLDPVGRPYDKQLT